MLHFTKGQGHCRPLSPILDSNEIIQQMRKTPLNRYKQKLSCNELKHKIIHVLKFKQSLQVFSYTSSALCMVRRNKPLQETKNGNNFSFWLVESFVFC